MLNSITATLSTSACQHTKFPAFNTSRTALPESFAKSLNTTTLHPTPVPKVTSPNDFSDLRPISVTPILSRIVERIIVRKYLMPSLPSDLLNDQFAYKLTGSTTSALAAINHHVAKLLETNSYVR